jgi:hypothetical protein
MTALVFFQTELRRRWMRDWSVACGGGVCGGSWDGGERRGREEWDGSRKGEGGTKVATFLFFGGWIY